MTARQKRPRPPVLNLGQERERAFFRQLFENTPGGVVILDDDDKVVDANRAFLRLFQYEFSEVIGQPINLLIVPEVHWKEASENSRRTRMLSRPTERLEMETVRQRKDGSRVDVAVLATPVSLVGKRLGIYAIYLDISKRRHAERALSREKEVAEVTLQAIGDAVIRTDAQGEVQYLNPVAERFTGWSLSEACGRPLRDVYVVISEQTRLPAPDPVLHCLQKGRVVGLANQSVLIHRDGREFGIEDSAAPVVDRQGQVIGVVLVFRDVTERRRLENDLAYQATHDTLTGLWNRSAFEGRLGETVRDRRRAAKPQAMLYLDLDQFKLLNDTHGHPAGDALLRLFASWLKKDLRETDLCARLGGDEFGVLLRECAAADAMEVAEKLLMRLADKRFFWRGKSFQVGASIGVVALDHNITGLQEALGAADEACYVAKESGRGRAYLYRHATREIRRRESEMQRADQLKRALKEERLELFYQNIKPLVKRSSAANTWHCELLVRLRDEQNRLVLPDRFVPAAERFGLIGALDRWVFGRAVAFLDTWQKTKDREPAPDLLDLNISAATISDPQFLEVVHDSFAASEAQPEKICFELTETVAVNNLPQTLAFIEAVHGYGCKVSLDDFGTGATSFFYLSELHIDYLKIDRAFITNLATEPMHQAIVDALHSVGRAAGIPCVAEGVDSQTTLRTLRTIGIEFGQGFILHRPRRWLRRSSAA